MEPTKILSTVTELLLKHGSDKGLYHSYGPIYEALFTPFRETATDVLEIGIERGNSLRAWREYFMFARIHGIDNDASKLVNDNRITSYHCDTTERDRFAGLFPEHTQFDIIIDDGSHVFTEQIFALFALWPHLKRGGLFIIEDIYKSAYLDLFRIFPQAEIHDLRHVRGQSDDMVVVLRK